MPKQRSFIKKLSEGVSALGEKLFFNPYHKIGVSWFTHRKFKYFASQEGLHTHNLFNHTTYFYRIPEYFHGLHEIFIQGIYKQQLPADAYVVDCGAHIGLSILYIKKLCPSAHVIAFEPDKSNFELLEKNVKSHLLQDVELRNEAVWNEDTLLNFIQDSSMSSKIAHAEKPAAVQVRAVRLRKIINRKIDFLKLDIEGAEYAVLKDISDCLHYVKNIFIEYHGRFQQNNELLEIMDILHKSGFRFYIKEAEVVYDHPFMADNHTDVYDIQLNIFGVHQSNS